MLTTVDIYQALGKHPGFRGVYPISDLPTVLLPRPSSLVINLDERWKPGSHWTAVFIPLRGPAFYFDSYGRYPPEQIIGLMERNSRDGWIYNKLKLQGDLSTFCGFYCIEFIRHCPDYNKFFLKYKHCSIYNDQNIRKVYETLFHL